MGEVFAGRYELVDPIGRGGAGAVWRAWDHRRRRYVAAKVLRQGDAHTLLRFVREQALRIDHPHVLAPTSWAADDDQVLFTMDLVSGGSLAHLIGGYGPLPPVFVCTLLDQLLAGLSAVHAEDVVHRDIKPANLLLEATGTGRPHLRLSDFGISMRKGEPRLTETNFIVGTPGYFAPEQLLGADPDFTADLYATGLVALYMLTGRKPDAEALMESYADGMPGPPEGVPEPLWLVLGTLLQPDPQVRFRTAVGVRKALADSAELLRGHPSVPGAPETVEVSDHIGPLPTGYGPGGPLGAAASEQTSTPSASPPSASDTGSFPLMPPSAVHPPMSHAAPAEHAGQPVAPGLPVAPRPGAPPYAHQSPLPYASPHPGTPAGERAGYGYGSPPPAGYSYPQQGGPPPPAQDPNQPAGYGGHPVAAAGGKVLPGPPPKIIASVLILALVLISVGVWALSQA